MLRNSIVSAIACLLLGTPFLRAQDTPISPDPLDTEYFMGDSGIDPEILRSIPVAAPHRAFLPVSADLKKFMPAPGDQGKLNSCQAWATGYAARVYYGAAFEGRDPRDNRNQPSPNYIYSLAIKGGDCEGGSNIVTVTDVLKRGAPSLADYPYATECRSPPPQLVSRARDFRVAGFRIVNLRQLDNIKGQLARSHPVVISMRVGPPFKRHRGNSVFTDTTRPAEGTANWGWHAMAMVGYDDRRQAFQLINSWGRGWGDGGFAWVGYDAFKALVRQAAVLNVDTPRRPVAFSEPPPAPPPKPPAPPAPPPSPVVAVTPPKPPPGPVVAVTPPPPKPPVQVEPVVNPQPPVMPVAPVAPPAPALRLSDLQKLPCSNVVATARAGRTILSGYVATDEDLATVKRVAAAAPNTSLGDVFIAPWPQCEALQTLAAPLAVASRPDIAIDPNRVYRAGETLKIEVRSPDQISYIYVAYVQADGTVVNLAQPKGVVPQPTLPHQVLIFGDGEAGRQTFTVTPPFGREMIVALASRSPLFDADLPIQQTEREYLSELRRALIYKPSPDLPDREVAASVVMLQTQGR